MTDLTEVRILLVGDVGVGKSSLITGLIKDQFVQPVAQVVPEVTVPAGWTKDDVSIRIIDSSTASPMLIRQLENDIVRADVIVVVYSVDSSESFVRVKEFWLPYIRKFGRNIPILLVGNKIDCRGPYFKNPNIEEFMLPLMAEFKELETYIECSTLKGINVAEVFYFAQKSVLHSTAPLYDSREHTLKPACIAALSRIFKLSDADHDGYLNKEELNNFQLKCFGVPLQNQEINNILESLKLENPLENIDKGVSENAFLYMNQSFVQNGRTETTWTILRKFGYGPDLELTEEYLYPHFDVPHHSTVELSSRGYQFFIDLFQSFDQDKDGALNHTELLNLFETAPPGNPWCPTGYNLEDWVLTNEMGSLTLQGFLAQWSMTTLLDYKKTLAYLAYLGYPDEDHTTALKVSKTCRRSGNRHSKSLIQKNMERSTFLAYVVGGPASGKTELLKNFLGKPFDLAYQPSNKPITVVNSVEIGGIEKYLVLQELPYKTSGEMLQYQETIDHCDLIVFLYDSGDPNSFSGVSYYIDKYSLFDVPCIFVATKSDTDYVQQKTEVKPDEYCRHYHLQVPLSISCKDNKMGDFYQNIVSVSMEPHSSLAGSVQNMTIWSFVGSLFGADTRPSPLGIKNIKNKLKLKSLSNSTTSSSLNSSSSSSNNNNNSNKSLDRNKVKNSNIFSTNSLIGKTIIISAVTTVCVATFFGIKFVLQNKSGANIGLNNNGNPLTQLSTNSVPTSTSASQQSIVNGGIFSSVLNIN